ncbi:MAG: transcription termination/antitermination protein NusG [Victivallaceae bacterium]|nr:transcription termination/antitermination protein NusG [Victivallaceae bacterium]
MDGEIARNENPDRGQWYVLHTLSGHEKKVCKRIESQLDSGDKLPVYELFVPEEKVSEVKQGQKRTTTRKFFPGYILIRMDMYMEDGRLNEAVWSYIRNTQGVLGFLGTGNRPTPLQQHEVDDLLRQARSEESGAVRPKIAFEIGETVRIKDGAFENFEGVIEEIDNERGKLKLMVSIFGRSTPVELEFWQVDRSI